MAIKFPKIPNPNTFAKAHSYRDLDRYIETSGYLISEWIRNKSILVNVTEKLDGENFRFGMDQKGLFIGRRNNHTYIEPGGEAKDFHPHGAKFNFDTNEVLGLLANDLRKWLDPGNHIPRLFNTGVEPCGEEFKEADDLIYYDTRLLLEAPTQGWKVVDATFFGELVGNKMQRRFKWNHVGLEVYWYDFAFTLRNEEADRRYTVYAGYKWLSETMGPFVRKFSHHFPMPYAFPTMVTINTTLGLVRGTPLDMALDFSVDDLAPKTPVSGPGDGDGVGEGVVLSSINPTLHPIRVKVKSARFQEAHDTGSGKKPPIDYASNPFARFVVHERILHAMQHVAEAESVSTEDMTDISQLGQHIGNVARRVVQDIETEENAGAALTKEDRRAVSKLAARLFRDYVLNGGPGQNASDSPG